MINVYALRRGTFDDYARLIGEQFAVPATVAVHNAQIQAQARPPAQDVLEDAVRRGLGRTRQPLTREPIRRGEVRRVVAMGVAGVASRTLTPYVTGPDPASGLGPRTASCRVREIARISGRSESWHGKHGHTNR